MLLTDDSEIPYPRQYSSEFSDDSPSDNFTPFAGWLVLYPGARPLWTWWAGGTFSEMVESEAGLQTTLSLQGRHYLWPQNISRRAKKLVADDYVRVSLNGRRL